MLQILFYVIYLWKYTAKEDFAKILLGSFARKRVSDDKNFCRHGEDTKQLKKFHKVDKDAF